MNIATMPHVGVNTDYLFRNSKGQLRISADTSQWSSGYNGVAEMWVDSLRALIDQLAISGNSVASIKWTPMSQ